jgi:hypothetical protein
MIGLVACCKKKLSLPSKAEELYISPFFRHASLYCKQQYKSWFILSANHGLLLPGEFIEPYDVNLRDKTKLEGQEWGQKVFEQLKAMNLQLELFCFHVRTEFCKFIQLA